MTTSKSKAIGSAAEREVAKIVGGMRIGQQLGPVDVVIPDYAQLQVKKVSTMPSLRAVGDMLYLMPDNGYLRGVVIIGRAGQGVKARRTITFDLNEWAEWHGAPQPIGLEADTTTHPDA